MRIAGIGFRGAATADAVRDALGHVEVAALATLARKADALRALDLGLPVIAVAQGDLAGVQTYTRSSRIDAEIGAGSLAEAAALVAAGPGARLVMTRRISSDGMATAAVAEGRDQ